jgi:hypothetical protein
MKFEISTPSVKSSNEMLRNSQSPIQPNLGVTLTLDVTISVSGVSTGGTTISISLQIDRDNDLRMNSH